MKFVGLVCELWKQSIVERTLRLTGGALEAVDKVLTGGFVMAANMAGGTHHAFFGQKEQVIAFLMIWPFAQRRHCMKNKSNRILILDLDVHQGDGTPKIFNGDDRVYTASLHGKNNFPFRKQVSDWDVEFANGAEDEEYLQVLDDVLSKLSEMKFDLIFFQAGVDGLASDALGLLNLSRHGLNQRNLKVFEWRQSLGLPMVIFMGGGYAEAY